MKPRTETLCVPFARRGRCVPSDALCHRRRSPHMSQSEGEQELGAEDNEDASGFVARRANHSTGRHLAQVDRQEFVLGGVSRIVKLEKLNFNPRLVSHPKETQQTVVLR